jgi:hypothetical protein
MQWKKVPVFYIDDEGYQTEHNRNGLHSDSTRIIFGNDNRDPSAYFNKNLSYDWGRAYCVTPKSFLRKAVCYWLDHQESIPKNEWIVVCSDRPYRRYELRSFAYEIPQVSAKGLSEPLIRDSVCDNFYHIPDLLLTDKDVQEACITAAKHFMTE